MLDTFAARQRRKLLGPGKSRLKIFSTLAILAFFVILLGFLTTGLMFIWFARDLPRPDKVRRVEGLSTIILDRKGEEIYDIYQNVNRIPAAFEDIPKHLKNGTVAIEDKDFYKHQGLSTAGIIRAMVNIFIFHNFQGGSTLTQQLVKTVLLTNERSLPRKIKEAILAIQIERKYSKDEILQMYLNEVPYGGTAVGVEAAAQYYFGKSVKELDLVESAILSGLPQSPSRYSPIVGEPKAYIWRTEQVLRRMREDGYITPFQETDAKNKLDKVQFMGADDSLKAPHFVAYVREQLTQKFGAKLVESGGLRVTTTLDLELQEKAQKIVFEEVEKAKKLKVGNGAAVAMDPRTGEILAMVGSKNYAATDSAGYKYNVATQGLRQPGSTLKPIVYAVALKKGYTPATMLMDVDTKYPSGDPEKPEYNPKNYDSKFRGPMLMRYALGNSVNTIAVKTTALVGVREVLKTAYDMGISSLEPTDDNLRRLGLSLPLGGGELTLLDLTGAFGVFATGGLKADPVSILRVTDAKGRELYKYQSPSPRRKLAEDVSYIISHMLSDNDARREVFGVRSHLVVPGKTVAVKTGTTDDKRDNWTVGYTPSAVVGTWVGNNDNSSMNPALASGVTGAAPIWNRIMQIVLKDQKDEPFLKPDNIVEVDIDGYAGGTPVESQPVRKEIFIKGTEPTTPAAIYQSVKLSKRDNNKLANSVEVAKGEYDTKKFVILVEQDPVSTDGKNRWQEGIDAWLATQSDSKFRPPKDTYQGDDKIAVVIKVPGGDQVQIDDNNVRVEAEATSTNEVIRLEIYVDGNKIKETGSKSISEIISIPDGSHILKVRAQDNQGNSSERSVKIGIKVPYSEPAPSVEPTPAP